MAIIKAVKTPATAAPLSETSVIGWIRKNLFSSVFNGLLTIVTIYFVYTAVKGIVVWGLIDAVWIADNRRECFSMNPNGACWAGVIAWMDNIFYGRYPRDELWRINLGIFTLFIWMIPLWLPRVKAKISIGLTTVFLYPFLAGYIFTGGNKGLFIQAMLTAAIVCLAANTLHAIIGLITGRSLPEFLSSLFGKKIVHETIQRNIFPGILILSFVSIYWWQMSWQLEGVPWTKWGGLFLTLVVSGVGIASALPGGIILALGRRSNLVVARVLSISIIELFRSVPLITVLFMATTMFPLFMPEGFVLNKLVQVIIAVCLFNSCYMAETVRGGLQTIPKGQFEAGHTIGLGYWQTMGLIIMPQALKRMIPNIVGNFISLLKDTTLVSIIGLFDVLTMLRSIGKDRTWLGLHMEPLVFGATLFFLICFAMSKYSRHLEVKLSTGHNN
ncbi:amino acid ABC transporter permease [Desulfocapsa sp. AH-315-G09]|nr:amino acid ABC transporter permease [Desulfocapsa sp.]MBN4048703.1 amino acid ABC transporter permease [bacterium AH-315-N22]MBN4065657.1 amino acid ABC transporter permease [Desulfocapsa sp. AH-315-G09]